MKVEDLAIFTEGGHLLNTEIRKDSLGNPYKYASINHKPKSSELTSTLNMYITEFNSKFLSDDNVYTQRWQVWNERGMTFYGVPSSGWLPITSIRLITDPTGIRQILALKFNSNVRGYKKGQLIKLRVSAKPGQILNTGLKQLTGNTDYPVIFSIINVQQTEVLIQNTIPELNIDWSYENTVTNFEAQFIGGIEIHDPYSLSSWNEKDFAIRLDTYPLEYVNRTISLNNFENALGTDFVMTSEKSYRNRNVWSLDMTQLQDHIYGQMSNTTISNSSIRIRIHEWKEIESLGNSTVRLKYPTALQTTTFTGLQCRKRPLQLSYGDWVWMTGDITIKSVTYKVGGTLFENRAKVTTSSGNIISFDRVYPNDFYPIANSLGNLPDPADFKDAILKGKLKIYFSRQKTTDFSYIAGSAAEFADTSYDFFTGLKEKWLRFNIWVEINYPNIYLDPRGSFSDYTLSIDIDGTPIFGYTPNPKYPDLFRWYDIFGDPNDITTDIYSRCQLIEAKSLFLITSSTFSDVQNYNPTILSNNRKKIKIKSVPTSGTILININQEDIVHSSNQFNIDDIVQDWINSSKQYLEFQKSIIVSYETDNGYPVIVIENKYPSLPVDIAVSEIYEPEILVCKISSIDQKRFCDLFSIRLGNLTKSVDVSDISNDFSLSGKEKTLITFQRFIANHETDLEVFGWKLVLLNPEIIVVDGPDINQISLEIWNTDVANPPSVEILSGKGWFIFKNYIFDTYPFQAITSNEIYRTIDGFKFTDMQIKPNDRTIIEGSLFKLNNSEYSVVQTFEQKLIIKSNHPFDQSRSNYSPYVYPYYTIDEQYVINTDDSQSSLVITSDKVKLYLLDRLFYPRSEPGNIREQLKISWLYPETASDYFFIDISGKVVEGVELDRVPYTGRTPLYLEGVKRKIILNNTYNKVLKYANNPYKQQTEFQILKRKLNGSENSAENFISTPLQFVLGNRYKYEGVHANTMVIESIKPYCITITPTPYATKPGYKFTWFADSDTQSIYSEFVNFEKCGVMSGDKVDITVKLLTGIITGSSSVENTLQRYTVKRVEKNRLYLDANLKSEVGLTIIPHLIIKSIEIENVPKLLAKIDVLSETIIEDKRLEVISRTFGDKIKHKDFYAFNGYKSYEWGNDYGFINKKRIELFLNRREIFDYVGSYKAIINSIKYFGHPELRIWNYALNLDKQSFGYGNWQKIELVKVGDAIDTGWDGIDKSVEPPRSTQRWVRNNWIHLVFNKTDETGKNTHLYTERDELLKLSHLSKWQKNNVIPMYNKLLDISAWSQQPWNVSIGHDYAIAEFYKQIAEARAVDFYVESYLNPISGNDHSWICSIRFSQDYLPPQGFWIEITTWVSSGKEDLKKPVNSYSHYQRNLQPYTFVMDWYIDTYATIKTVVEDPLTGARAITSRNYEIFSRITY